MTQLDVVGRENVTKLAETGAEVSNLALKYRSVTHICADNYTVGSQCNCNG